MHGTVNIKKKKKRKLEIHRNFLPKSSGADASQDQSDDDINVFIRGTRLK